MATLVLQIPDESLVSKVKQACKMIMGVASVKVQKSHSGAAACLVAYLCAPTDDVDVDKEYQLIPLDSL